MEPSRVAHINREITIACWTRGITSKPVFMLICSTLPQFSSAVHTIASQIRKNIVRKKSALLSPRTSRRPGRCADRIYGTPLPWSIDFRPRHRHWRCHPSLRLLRPLPCSQARRRDCWSMGTQTGVALDAEKTPQCLKHRLVTASQRVDAK